MADESIKNLNDMDGDKGFREQLDMKDKDNMMDEATATPVADADKGFHERLDAQDETYTDEDSL